MPKQQRSARGRGRSPNSTATRVYERVRTGVSATGRSRTFAISGNRVAHALSRLASQGELQRLRKGLYYRPKQTVIGPSVPSASAAVGHTLNAPLHPTRLSAGNVLGFSTQNPAHAEFATPAAAAPGALRNATVHTRRPASRFELDAADGALLELLRDRARYSDLSPQETVRRLVSMLSDRARFRRLAKRPSRSPRGPRHARRARGAGGRSRRCA